MDGDDDDPAAVPSPSPSPSPSPPVAQAPDPWNGPEGRHWVRHRVAYDRLVAGYQTRLLAACRAAHRGGPVLDVGCGTGQLTRDLAAGMVAGSVVGVDISRPMVVTARRLAAGSGLANTSYLAADAGTHAFPYRHFGLAVSRFGLMFFDPPVPALANLARSLRAGAELKALVWRPLGDNEWLRVITAACTSDGEPVGPPVGRPGAFALADPQLARGWLAAAGFVSVELAPWDEKLDFGPDPEQALAFVRSLPPVRSLLARHGPAERRRRVARLGRVLAGAAGSDGVHLGSGAWLISARVA